jgi:hypothetical protein
MASYARKSLVTLFAGAALVTGVATPSSAQPVEQDGLVNVNIGDNTLRDAVDIGVAAQVAAEICGVKVGPVAVLAKAVDRSGETRTVCQSDQGPITISNNN